MEQVNDTNPYAEMSNAELEQTIRKAMRVKANQEGIVKAADAYTRLMRTEDFPVVVQHLVNTMTYLGLDAPKRPQENQQHDLGVMRSIATVLSMLEDLPAIGSSMTENLKSTEATLAQLQAAK